MSSSKQHDRSYKRLFSNPVILRQLLETCVDEPWVSELDFSSLEYLSTEHVDKRLIASQNDMLFQIRFADSPALLLVILEFQSTPDRFMALRVLNYLCTVYKSYLKKNKNKKNKTIKTLPPVFPIVLYNGADPWPSPLQISDLIDIPEESGKMRSLRAYIPSFKYLCIDAKHYNEEILEEKQSLVSSLFLLEKNWEEGVESRTKQSAEYIAKHLKKEENKEATHDLIDYIVFRLNLERMEGNRILAGEFSTAEEISKMIEDGLERMKQRERKIGIEIGEERGIQIGEERGIQIGEERGEHEQKVKTAKKLLAKGYPPGEVAEIVELDEEEIRKLLH